MPVPMPALAPVLKSDEVLPADVSVLVCVGLANEFVLEGAVEGALLSVDALLCDDDDVPV